MEPSSTTPLRLQWRRGRRPDIGLLIPNKHRPRHIEAFRAAMSTGLLTHAGRPALIEATHKDGHTIEASMTLAVLGDDVTAVAQGAVAVLRHAHPESISFIDAKRLVKAPARNLQHR